MNFKIKNRTLVNADIVSPVIAYAEFSTDLAPAYCKEIVETLNYGHEMLRLYKAYRNNLSLGLAADMVEKMELIFRAWDYKLFEIRKTN